MEKLPDDARSVIEGAGGVIKEVGDLPDGSGFAVASFPLPADHWLTEDHRNVPPMPMRMAADNPDLPFARAAIRAAAMYAARGATMNGKEMDFDPDALVQNMLVGMLGYCTPDGLSPEAWANPASIPAEGDWSRDAAQMLWQMLDDIDTLDDVCKGDDATYRRQARAIQQKRFMLYSSDGYTIKRASPKPKDSP